MIFGLIALFVVALILGGIGIVILYEDGPTTIGVFLIVGSIFLIFFTKVFTLLLVPTFSGTTYYLHYHWKTLLSYIGVYLAIGLVYSIVKWFLQARDICRRFKPEEEISDYVVNNELNPLKHKKKVSTWVFFWPFSLIGTLLADLPKRVANFFVERFQAVYNTVTRMALRSMGRTYRP